MLYMRTKKGFNKIRKIHLGGGLRLNYLDYENYRKCDKCGESPKGRQQGVWTVYDNHCECGGYIRTDFKYLFEDEKKI